MSTNNSNGDGKFYQAGVFNSLCRLDAGHVPIAWVKKMRPMLSVVLATLLADHWRYAAEHIEKGDYRDVSVTVYVSRYSLKLGINERTLRRAIEELETRNLIECDDEDERDEITFKPLFDNIMEYSDYTMSGFTAKMEHLEQIEQQSMRVPSEPEPELETHLL